VLVCRIFSWSFVSRTDAVKRTLNEALKLHGVGHSSHFELAVCYFCKLDVICNRCVLFECM